MVLRISHAFFLSPSLSRSLSHTFSLEKSEPIKRQISDAYENVDLVVIKGHTRTAFVSRRTPTRDRPSVSDYLGTLGLTKLSSVSSYQEGETELRNY